MIAHCPRTHIRQSKIEGMLRLAIKMGEAADRKAIQTAIRLETTHKLIARAMGQLRRGETTQALETLKKAHRR